MVIKQCNNENREFEKARVQASIQYPEWVEKGREAAKSFLKNWPGDYRSKQRMCKKTCLSASTNKNSAPQHLAWHEGVLRAKQEYSNASPEGRKARKAIKENGARLRHGRITMTVKHALPVELLLRYNNEEIEVRTLSLLRAMCRTCDAATLSYRNNALKDMLLAAVSVIEVSLSECLRVDAARHLSGEETGWPTIVDTITHNLMSSLNNAVHFDEPKKA